MGSFHCIPSSCATVWWREYLAPVVRWRYPGEDWQEIEADDYKIDSNKPKFDTEAGKRYRIQGKAICSERTPPPRYVTRPVQFEQGEEITVYLLGTWTGGIYGWELKKAGKNASSLLTYLEHTSCNVNTCFCQKGQIERTVFARNRTGNNVRCKSEGESISEPIISLLSLHSIEAIEVSANEKPCRNEIIEECTFSVYKDGTKILEITKDNCPEVEQLPCRLSDVFNSIKIEKEPYLQRVEVRSEGIDYVSIIPPLLQAYDIPEECLNIYLTYTLAPPIITKTGLVPAPINLYQFINQICSAPGCPPPKYEVICDCDDCELCPKNTCEVECGDHICCYDKSTGIAVKEIPLTEYCGGQN